MKSLSSLRASLERAASDLTPPGSEADYAFRFFSLPNHQLVTPTGLDSPATFLGLLGITSNVVEKYGIPVNDFTGEYTLDRFIPHEAYDPDDPDEKRQLKRWQKLKATLEANLTDIKVFRVGYVEVFCYIAGHDERGDIAGLVAVKIET